ncbi:Ionotropic receptor 910 [Blattella germanica]|nr:Ionotropic receptor 910 [Blattella germanica]
MWLQHILSLYCFWGCYGNLLAPTEDSYIEKHVFECILHISKTHIEKEKPLLVLTHNNTFQSQNKSLQYDKITQILHNEFQYPIISFGVNNIIRNYREIKPNSNVVIYPPIETERKVVRELLRKLKFFPNAKGKYIIAATRLYNNVEDRIKVSRFLIQSVFKLNVIHIIALVPYKTDNQSHLLIDVFTWNPNEQKNICYEIIDKVKLIDVWNTHTKRLLYNENLFPTLPKIHMRECRVHVKSGFNFPFIIRDKHGVITGSMMNIIRIIHEDMRCRVVLGNYVENEHIAFPFVYSPLNRISECSLTYPHFRQDVTWFVPPGLEYPRWQSLVRSLSPVVWALILLIFVIGSYVIKLLGNYESEQNANVTAILTALQTYLGSEASDRFKGPLAVSFFSIWLFYWLIINTAYQSAMFGLLVNPGQMPPVKTFKELKESGLQMKKAITFDSLMNSTSNLFLLRDEVVNYEPCTADKCYINLTKYRNIAVFDTAVRGNLYKKFKLDERGRYQLYPLDENIASVHIGIAIRKLSCILYNKLEKTLRRLNTAGFINKWNEDIIMGWRYDNEQYFDSGGVAFAFTLSHVQGTFYLLLIGLMLALIAFIIETVVYTLRS